MVNFILVIIVATSTFSEAGITSLSQDFITLENCEAAKKVLVADITARASEKMAPKDMKSVVVSANCFKK